ncbi:MAG: hypothetical protein ACOCMW_03605 [Campylobacter hyointestinalis]|nr:hypothetical protein CR67_03810 [Campylobacter hyointestinalis subsp. hyointestinalis]QKF55259.1 hypothetical protein CHHT_0387 [Campylobacter hyointestinalis subsp. hyointestinalis]SFT49771.1 hypothetical protein SAMN05421691_0854 [Campylobacter hyointestinalis]
MMSWIDEFKIALVNEDLDKIDYLTNNYPNEMSLDEMRSTLALINEAAKMFKEKQKKLDIEFQKIKKARQYNI